MDVGKRVHTVFFDRFFPSLRIFVERYGINGQNFVKALSDSQKMRNFMKTGAAPRSPKIYEQKFRIIISDILLGSG